MAIDESHTMVHVVNKLLQNITATTDEVFPHIAKNDKNHQWAAQGTCYISSQKQRSQCYQFQALKTKNETKRQWNRKEFFKYPTTFLNLLGNINPPRLCNGTWLSIKKMMNSIIKTAILNWKLNDVLLPCITMIPTDMISKLKRLLFPVRLAFPMTISNERI